jgi:hypothetical protein
MKMMKKPVNEALREGMPRIGTRRSDRKRFAVMPHSPGLRAGIDPGKISQYAEEIFDDEKLRKSVR